MNDILFVFDLDCTLTRAELLPQLAEEIGIAAQIDVLTERAMAGGESYRENFLKRVELMRALPVSRAQEIAANALLFDSLAEFTRIHRDRALILSGNLDVWIEKLLGRLGMRGRCLCSRGAVENDRIASILYVMDKSEAVQALPHPFVAIGDGENDVPMLRAADFAIAFGGARKTPAALAAVADRVVRDEAELRALLDSIAENGLPPK